MKFKDLKALSEKDILSKEKELEKELMKLRSQIRTGTAPEKPGRAKQIRKTLAKMKFIQSEKIKEIKVITKQ